MIKQYKSIPNSTYWTKVEYCENLPKLVKKYTLNKPLFKLLLNLITKNDKVLEGGAGNGWIVAAMHQRSMDWIGIEYSKPLVEEFKKQYPDYKSAMYYADARKLPFEDNCFDVYFSPGIIEHYEESPDEIKKILGEAKRVVKANGKILILVPIMNLPRWIGIPLSRKRERKSKHLPFYQCIYTKKELKNRLKASGLAIKKSYGSGVHGFKIFGITMFPKCLWSNYILNYFFRHMILVECINIKS